MISKEFWTSATIGKLSANARLLFIGMFNFSDDWGVHLNSDTLLLGEIFLYDGDVTPNDVNGWKNELIENELIYQVNNVENKSVLLIRSWEEHQKISNRSFTTAILSKKTVNELRSLLAICSKEERLQICEDYTSILRNNFLAKVERKKVESRKKEVISQTEIFGCEKISFTDIKAWWNNEICDIHTNIRPIRAIDEKRKKKIRTRWNNNIMLNRITFDQLKYEIVNSLFLQGINKRGWVITFDWLIENDLNINKVLEGRYRDKGSAF
jgi:hypothetical protein